MLVRIPLKVTKLNGGQLEVVFGSSFPSSANQTLPFFLDPRMIHSAFHVVSFTRGVKVSNLILIDPQTKQVVAVHSLRLNSMFFHVYTELV